MSGRPVARVIDGLKLSCGTQKRKQPQKELLSFFLLIKSRVSEPDLRASGGTEIVAVTIVQEHDFVPGFHAETEPAGVKFNAAAGIEDAVRVAINNIANLVVDDASGDRTTDAKVHKAALQQAKNAYRPGTLNLQTKEAMEQPQIGADGAGDDAGGDGLSLIPLKVIGHLTFQDDVLSHVDTKPRAHTKHVEVGRLKAGKISIHAKVSVVFIVTALGRCRRGK
jgi:hypothetical protein